MFTIDQLILLGALVVTTLSVWRMHRRLRLIQRHHADAEQASADLQSALAAAQDALARFSADGRLVAVTLSAKIDVARQLIAELEARRVTDDATSGTTDRIVAFGRPRPDARTGP